MCAKIRLITSRNFSLFQTYLLRTPRTWKKWTRKIVLVNTKINLPGYFSSRTRTPRRRIANRNSSFYSFSAHSTGFVFEIRVHIAPCFRPVCRGRIPLQNAFDLWNILRHGMLRSILNRGDLSFRKSRILKRHCIEKNLNFLGAKTSLTISKISLIYFG